MRINIDCLSSIRLTHKFYHMKINIHFVLLGQYKNKKHVSSFLPRSRSFGRKVLIASFNVVQIIIILTPFELQKMQHEEVYRSCTKQGTLRCSLPYMHVIFATKRKTTTYHRRSRKYFIGQIVMRFKKKKKKIELRIDCFFL